MDQTTPLLGSSEDVGYLRVTTMIKNETRATLMLSTRSETSFFVCPTEELTGCGNPSENNALCNVENENFVQTFKGASASGRYYKNSFLCFDQWCSAPVPTTTGEKNHEESTFSPASSPSDKEEENGSNRMIAEEENRNETTDYKGRIGCTERLTGSLKENIEAGVWGIGPRGIHPDYITMCFGSKRLPGRISPILEADLSAKINWIPFVRDFEIVTGQTQSPPIQFLSPDTVWDNSEKGVSTTVDTITYTRIDFSSTYSWLPPKWFAAARDSLFAACDSLGCQGYHDYSDGASMACFRFPNEGMESYLPDLEWRILQDVRVLVPPSRYMFTTDDGSRCVGFFQSASDTLAIVGLNMLIGLRLRIDYVESQLKLDTCVSKDMLPVSVPGDPNNKGGIETLVEQAVSGTWSVPVKVAVILLCLALGITLGVLVAVRMKKKYSTFFQAKKKSFFRASSFLRNNFRSRKQTFKSVRFKEELDESSDDEDRLPMSEMVMLNATEQHNEEKNSTYAGSKSDQKSMKGGDDMSNASPRKNSFGDSSETSPLKPPSDRENNSA